MVGFRYLMPAGLVRLWEFQQRFRALGLPDDWAHSQKYRKALDMAEIELIPAESIPTLKCVIDVGANLGDWSVGIALLTHAKEIIAYEPVPQLFEQLQNNIKSYSQIRCVNRAVGATVGYVEINVHQRHQLSSVLTIQDEARHVHGMEQDVAVPVRVPLTTLDEDLRDRTEISLLKIDVQGYEPQVLEGARAVLKRTEILMIEVTYSSYYQGDMQFADLHRLVTSIAPFRLWGISAPHCAPSGKPMWADAVYVRTR